VFARGFKNPPRRFRFQAGPVHPGPAFSTEPQGGRLPIVRVTRRVHFNAAHRLHNPALSDEENRRIYGPCNHPNWHGHNYDLDITVEG